MSADSAMTGKILNNRYEVGERIGVGGMAEVYSAQDNVLGRIVAVKVMLSQYAEEEDFARRFRQEAAAAANLQSPYIVNVYDWGHDAGTYFIVMEYVRGSDLKSAIKQRGAINQRKVAEIGSQVCQALSVAHSQDIIHRDIKPQNIMIQPDGNVKVMDFGIARAKNSVSQKTGNVLGTAHYISPEQAQGKDLTAATDIYSLGVVMYEAVTGKLPFDAPDAMSVAMMQVQDEPMAPSAINSEVDPALEAVIMRAMSKDPAARFTTAHDMKVALNDYLAGRANPSFTQAQTSVIAPVAAGAVAGAAVGAAAAADHTAVMSPVNAQGAGNASKTYSNENTSKGGMSGKKKAGIVCGILVALVAIGVLCWAFMGQGGNQVEVPDVTGKTTEQAIQIIQDAGFEVGTKDSAYDPNVEAGHVSSQSPKGGNKAEKGSKINLVISQGTEEIEVPDVTGKSLSDAQNALTKAGFVVGNTTEENSDKVEPGKVAKQDPQGGKSAKKGSTVNLVVSKGADTVSVPDITGLSPNRASRVAEELGFTIYQSGSQASDTVDEGLIISQTLVAGTKATKGSSIGYIISTGKKSVTVPNVVGNSWSGAKSTIEGLGLTAYKAEEYSDSVAKGNVISTNPSAGSSVDSGSTVTVTVSLGPSSNSSSSTETNTNSGTNSNSSSSTTN